MNPNNIHETQRKCNWPYRMTTTDNNGKDRLCNHIIDYIKAKGLTLPASAAESDGRYIVVELVKKTKFLSNFTY